MRAREFTINVPITIKINGDGDPEIEMDQTEDDPSELEDNPVFVSPLQQELELKKAEAGKHSPVIADLIKDEGKPKEKPSLLQQTQSSYNQ